MNNSEVELIINNLESEGFAIMKDVAGLDECNKMVLALMKLKKYLQGNKIDLSYYFQIVIYKSTMFIINCPSIF